MSTLGSRIAQELKLKGWDWPELSRRSGVGYSTLKEIESGRQKSSTKLWAIAAALDVADTYLATGKGRRERDALGTDPEWSNVRGYSQAAGLGAAGAEAEEYAESHKLKFKASSLQRKRLQPDNLAIFYGKGDSMLPRIHDGDAIMFDTADIKPRDGTLYVIQVHGAANPEYQVKRALLLDDDVFFVADNPAGDHSWVKPRRMDAKRGRIAVIGRVRWIGSWED
jgi:phage repressor protein C with HTH and peptisase S24 domain